jgi:hypothetical protein
MPILQTVIVWQQTAVKCLRVVTSPTVDVAGMRALFLRMRRLCVVVECVV